MKRYAGAPPSKVAVERILRFKAAVARHNPDCFFSINYTVLLDNIDEVSDAVSFWDQHGFEHVGFIAMVVRADTDYLRGQSIERSLDRFQAQIDRAARYIIDNRSRLSMSNSIGILPTFAEEIAGNISGPILLSDNPNARSPLNPRPIFQNRPYPGMEVNCASPFKAIKLLYDGTLQVCSKFKIGNIYESGSLLQTWRGFMAEKVRSSILAKPKICYHCDYYRFCIRSGQIDHTKAENFRSSGSSEPRMISRFMGCPVIEWANEYVLLMPDHGPFDIRFDQLGPSVMLHADDYETFLESLSNQLAQTGPVDLECPSNLHRFWRVGEWLMAAPFDAFDGLKLTVKNLEELYFARSMYELRCAIAASDGRERSVPILVDSLHEYNIVRYAGKFIGIPQAAGPLDVDKVDLSTIDGVVDSWVQQYA